MATEPTRKQAEVHGISLRQPAQVVDVASVDAWMTEPALQEQQGLEQRVVPDM